MFKSEDPSVFGEFYADLQGIYLSGANLSGANLTDADLSGANLSGANCRKAKLKSEQLQNVFSIDGADFRDTGIKPIDLPLNKGTPITDG